MNELNCKNKNSHFLTRWIYIRALAFCLIVPGNFFVAAVNAEKSIEIKGVKYYFDNIESFNKNLSSRGISQKVIIKGKLLEVEVQAVCIKSPCPPVKQLVLQDINDEHYKISIYQVNRFAQQLEEGKIYAFKGILEKDVDWGRKIVYISNFKPQEIIENR